MKDAYTVNGITFMETCYSRNINGRTVVREYSKVAHIKVGDKVMPTHRAIAYAKANPIQRYWFRFFHAHHINHNHQDNRLSNIKVMFVISHINHHYKH